MTFDAIFVPDAMREAVDDRAWLSAMLEAEAALARAQARLGVIPSAGAAAVADACRVERFDADALARAARADGNPVPALKAAVMALEPEGSAARWFHHGATSQDIVDTAAMLVARRALALIRGELAGVAAACAGLAETHRDTPMVARTLMQQAVPTTFGLKAAGWLDAVLDTGERLGPASPAPTAAGGAGLDDPSPLARGAALDDPSPLARRAGLDQPPLLAAQLGGAGGTLASMGDVGPVVLSEFARELGLAEPLLPWHSHRGRIAALGAALAIAAGTCAKIALDVILMNQNEVGEVRSGSGRSSAMAHKSNPVEAIRARACATRVSAAAGLLLAGVGDHEYERAAGAWHAEWAALSEALALTGGAAAAAREMLEGLEILTDRMVNNLESLGSEDGSTGSAGVFVDGVLERYRAEMVPGP